MSNVTILNPNAGLSIDTANAAPANVGADGKFKVANINGGVAKFDLSSQWAARPADQRFTSLDELLRFRRNQLERAKEATMLPGMIEAQAPEEVLSKRDTEKLNFLLPSGESLNATHWAFGQVAARAKSPASFLRELPSQYVADILNYRLRYSGNAEGVKIMYTSQIDEDGRETGSLQLDAVTGPDYGRVLDTEIIEAVQRHAGNGRDARWRIPGSMDWSTMVYDPHTPVTKGNTTLFASDRDIFIFLVDDLHPIVIGKVLNPRTGQMEDDIVFRGFFIKNSMVGGSSLVLACFYLRSICCNRIMWGVEGFQELRIRHTRLAPERFLTQAMPALDSFSNGATQRLIDGVNAAKAAKVASDDDEMLEFLNQRKFTRKTAAAVMAAVEKEEGHKARTVWDLAQGITAVARDIPHTDERVQMELQAKVLLDKVA